MFSKDKGRYRVDPYGDPTMEGSLGFFPFPFHAYFWVSRTSESQARAYIPKPNHICRIGAIRLQVSYTTPSNVPIQNQACLATDNTHFQYHVPR